MLSENGPTFGIDILNSCSGVTITNSSVKGLTSSNEFDHMLKSRITSSGFSVTGISQAVAGTGYTVAPKVVISASGQGIFGNGCHATLLRVINESR